MPDTRAVLGRLTAGAIGLEPLFPGGPAPETTRSDIAGALAGLPQAVGCLLLAKYAGDSVCANELIELVCASIRSIAERGGWFDEELILRLAGLAVAECLNPQRCLYCRGRGHTTGRTGTVKACRHCDGTGYAKVSEAARARMVGIEYHHWRRSWRDRYYRMVELIEGWEATGARHVSRQLRPVAP